MNKKTLKALKGAIKKWERIVKGIGEDKGMDNCPLCEKFLKTNKISPDCCGCPVFQKTKRPRCCDSPYGDWLAYVEDAPVLLSDDSDSYRVFDKTSKALAIKELQFLKSLLPKK